jgi:hypothetical protein
MRRFREKVGALPSRRVGVPIDGQPLARLEVQLDAIVGRLIRVGTGVCHSSTGRSDGGLLRRNAALSGAGAEPRG